jgi:hypothetical protein
MRIALALVVCLLAAACGSETPRPARRPRRQERMPETLQATVLRPLDGECGPDRQALEVPEEGYASEMFIREGRAFFQIARRVDRGVLGSIFSRPVFEGESSLEVDVIETIIGETPVILVVDIAHRSESCDEGAACPSDVTTAWSSTASCATSPPYDQRSASVEANKLVVGGEKRVPAPAARGP